MSCTNNLHDNIMINFDESSEHKTWLHVHWDKFRIRLIYVSYVPIKKMIADFKTDANFSNFSQFQEFLDDDGYSFQHY